MWLRIFFVCLLAICPAFVFSQGDVEIKYEDNNGVIDFICINNSYCDQMVKVSFDNLRNLKSNRSVPFVGSAAPGRSTLFRLTKVNEKGDYNFSYKYNYIDGRYRPKIKDDFLYLLPVANGKKAQVIKIDELRKFLKQQPKGNFYAYGFAMHEGDTVYASRGGRVCNVSNTNPVKGNCLIYSANAAYVRVFHKDGTFGRYNLLQREKIFVKSGQYIHPGDAIGIVYHARNYNNGPCVIFSVSYTDNKVMDDNGSSSGDIESVSIPLMFLYNENKSGILIPNLNYTSIHSPEVITKEMRRRQRKKWHSAHKK